MRHGIPGIGLCIALVLGMAYSATARDGAREINQAAALRGSVTPGDAPGFPVTLSEAGSYVLTGSLTVTSIDETAIRVDADDVSVDLNGFGLEGPVSCQFAGANLDCGVAGTGTGIEVVAGHRRHAVRDGSVHGFGGRGLVLGDECRVEKLLLSENGGGGARVGDCVVRNVLASRNGGAGVEVGEAAIVTGVMTEANRSDGIRASYAVLRGNSSIQNGFAGLRADSAVAADNTSSQNGRDGLELEVGIVVGNTLTYNSGVGLFADPSSAYVRNVLNGNVGGDVVPTLGIYPRSFGWNFCGAATFCP